MKDQPLPEPVKPRRSVWRWYRSRATRTQISLLCALLVTLVVLGLGAGVTLGYKGHSLLHHLTKVLPISIEKNTSTTVSLYGASPTNTLVPTSVPTPASTTNVSNVGTPTTNQAQGGLPGEQIWKNGVSSYIFGTTDTGEWNAPNIEFTNSLTAPGTLNTVVQNLVKQAGFPFMRKFIGHHGDTNNKEKTDATLQAISDTISNTGTQCLINIFSIDPSSASQLAGDQYTDLQFAQHLATLFDGNHSGFIKCSMFEIGNEPDDNGLSASQYATVWNDFVTALKQVRSDAKFIGPVLATYNPGYMQDFLQAIVQNHYPVPDAIDWHYYPCGWSTNVNWQQCFAQSIPQDNPITQAQDIRARMQNILGHQLPIGISEWSSDASGILPTTEPQMSQFITETLNQMIQAKLDFANEYDMQSFAGYGAFDMIDQNNQPRPYFYTFANMIKQYKP